MAHGLFHVLHQYSKGLLPFGSFIIILGLLHSLAGIPGALYRPQQHVHQQIVEVEVLVGSETEQVQMPIVLFLVLASLCVNVVANDPRGGAAATMTTIPFFSPVLMPMRYLLGGASTAEVLVSLAVLLASIWLAIGLAARIYRVGILMYGKRPSLRELARWVRR